MKRILGRWDDENTMGIVLYESENNQLFFDAEFKEGVTREELAKIEFHPLLVIDRHEPSVIYRVVWVNREWGLGVATGGSGIHAIYCSDVEPEA